MLIACKVGWPLMALSVHSGELRRHMRVAFERRAWCEHRDWTLYLPIANVSIDGLFIQTSTSFASGELLRVCLTDRNPLVSPLIELEAEVRWSAVRGRAIGVGCRILDFTTGADRYAELVEQLTQLGR